MSCEGIIYKDYSHYKYLSSIGKHETVISAFESICFCKNSNCGLARLIFQGIIIIIIILMHEREKRRGFKCNIAAHSN